MDGAITDQIRALAPKWSLAGDNQLLELLQSTHQRIISKCHDVNSKLDGMATALDGASISLQNVNNKFMALSNSQFLESRVYDDDADVTAQPEPVKESPRPEPRDEPAALRRSLAALEAAHETAEIVDDSDSDSSDTEISVVLRPKDMYPHRPLPYIIGSQPWRNKWHAGLVVEEDSDTDSSAPRDTAREQQYSDSESERDVPVPGRRADDPTISETSSSFHSEQPTIDNTPPQARPTPADVAAELARRLGRPVQPIQQNAQEYSPPARTTTKVYKPEQPVSSTIFPDEPPPLDYSSEDDDIFAEINKNKPYNQSNRVQNNLADDLFGLKNDDYVVEKGDIFSDFAENNLETKPVAKQKSTLFEEELFAEPRKTEVQNSNYQEDISSTKKPVGGISLFGSNKGAESIGSAILKRNRRKSTSGEESGSDDTTNNNTEETRDNTHISHKTTENNKQIVKNYEKVRNVSKNTNVFRTNVVQNNDNDETDNKSISKNEKDIFDDLFAKSEVKEQRSKDKQPKPVKDTVNVKNLFSDNIFDDIDDIFTTDVKMPSKDTKHKSIFDDDDLFSDIAKPKSVNQLSSKDNKIFDSDDDLFSDVKLNKNDKNLNKNTESQKNNTSVQKGMEHTTIESTSKMDDINKPTKNKNSGIKSQIETKSIFDSDSDDDIFSNIKISEGKKNTNVSIEKGSDNENLTIKNSENVLKSYVKESKSVEKKQKTDKDLIKEVDKETKLVKESLKVKDKSNVIQSPSLFDDDEIEELFDNTSKLDKVNAPKENNTERQQKIIKSNEIKDTTSVLDITTKITKKNTDCSIERRKEVTRSSESKFLSQKDNNFQEKGPEIISKPIGIESNPVTKQTTKNTDQSEEFVKKKSDIFDNSLSEDNSFSNPKEKCTTKSVAKQFLEEVLPAEEVIEPSPEISKTKTAEKQNNRNFMSTSVEAEIPHHLEHTNLDKNTELPIEKEDLTPLDTNLSRSIFEDFSEPVKEKQTAIPESQNPISNDIFDDIFSEPPAFEKPVEPKKSKNVNALFDDDSDDDALFFKKNDVISDEKPEIFSSNANFDLFVDEPPAIDVGFVIKNDNDSFDDNASKSASKNFSFDNHLSTSSKSNFLNKSDDDLSRRVPKYKDKPPTIDVATQPDFKSEKSIENKEITKSQSSIFSQDKDKNKLNTFEPEKPSKTEESPEQQDEIIQNTLGKDIDSDDEFFSSLPNPKIPKSSQKEENESLKSNLFENDKKSKEESSPSKKIGKLNAKNLNINVNALVPGASPKKIPKETKDDQYIPPESDAKQKMANLKTSSGENTSMNVKSDKKEPNAVKHSPNNDGVDHESKKEHTDELQEPKSIDFEEKPDSGILDNNISKQRPRIQVKRRPSSRKARLEAVRKSAVIGFDDTDNSSSFDEPAPSKSHVTKSISKVKNTERKQDPSTKIQNQITNDTTSCRQEKSERKDYKNESNESHNTHKEIDSNLSEKPDLSSTIEKDVQNIKEQKTTTKVVYILNDEDIFNTKTKDLKSPDNNVFKNTDVTKTLDTTENTIKNTGFKTHENISKESSNIRESRIANDELFKTEAYTQNDDDIFQSKGVNTLGKNYKTKSENVSSKDTLKDVKSSLFDDSDDELFNKNDNNQIKNVVKQSLFDTDSEDDLFGGKKRKEQKNQEVKEKKDMMQTSLFGDDENDDDDDLFGVKTKGRADQRQSSAPSTSREPSNKAPERVFDDPLSLLGDD